MDELVAWSKSQEANKESAATSWTKRGTGGISGSFAALSPSEYVQVYLLLFSLGSGFTVLHQRNSFFQMMLCCLSHSVFHHLTAFCSLQL